MRTFALTSAVAIAALFAGTGLAAAGPYGYAAAPLIVRPVPHPCALGYQLDETGRCSSNSFGFGVSSYPLGYSVGPFANFAPLYGRPYRPVAVQGFSEYVAGY